MSGGDKQVVRGRAGYRIEELVGADGLNPDDPGDIRIAAIRVHGHPGGLFALSPDVNGGVAQLAFTWNNGTCAESVLLVPGASIETAEAYVGRF